MPRNDHARSESNPRNPSVPGGDLGTPPKQINEKMELRHLRYFLAVGESLSFTKAAARLRVAQPALSRQMRDLEDEIGVDLLRRGPRGVTLTPEGRLFLAEAREILKLTGESVKKVHAMVRGQYSELHIGYRVPTIVEILPQALAAFRKAVPGVKVLLHELAFDELIAGLRSAALELAILLLPTSEHISKPTAVRSACAKRAGIEFESLHTYPLCVALNAAHPLAQLESIPLERLAAEPILGLRRNDYRGYLDRIFAPTGFKPRIVTECDTFSSVLIEVEAGHGIALFAPIYKLAAGERLLYRRITGTTESLSVGIARAKNGTVTPAGEEFCEILRNVSNGATTTKSGPLTPPVSNQWSVIGG
jgi:DNA-binding transcriptional LysR family regulator